jgi:hypothetical protein
MSLFDRDELRALIASSESAQEDPQIQALSRREVLAWIEEFAAGIKEQLRSVDALDPALRDERVEACRGDFDRFRRTYFPHYYTLPGRSDLQEGLEEIYAAIAAKARTDRPGIRHALAAPRGFGKSTDVSVVFPIYCIVYDLKRFITLISDAIELTETLIEAIKTELEANPRLRADFPESTGIGPSWKVGEIVTNNGIKLKGFGSAKRIRGQRHGVHRVDLVLIDDLENDENVRSRTQRDKLEEWLDSAIENLGDVTGTMDIIYIGTLLHRDSVLARKLKLAFWRPRIYRAILRYPDRMDLWDEYARIYRAEGDEAARQFYADRREQMDAGARLLWDAVSLESLMRKRAANPRAFEREQQNRPGSEDQRFDSGAFTVIPRSRCPRFDRTIAYTDFKGTGAKGASRTGDYSVVVAGGMVRGENRLYVFLSTRNRHSGKKAVDWLADLQARYSFDTVGGESNGAFALYLEWYRERCEQRRIDPGQIRLKAMRDAKEVRIESLEHPLDDGRIVFVGEHGELFAELDDFPEADYDDLSDALAGLWRLSKLAKKQTKKRTRYKKRPRSRR